MKIRIAFLYFLILSLYFPSLWAQTIVYPQLETQSFLSTEDSVDDPAFWLHPTDPARSLIFATVKNFGIIAYSLRGKKIFSYPGGGFNNVDIRYNVPINEGNSDILAVSSKEQNAFILFEIKSDLHQDDFKIKLRPLLTHPTGDLKAYGLCLFQNQTSRQLNVIITGKAGNAHLYAVKFDNSRKYATLQQVFYLGGKNEGCVVDDKNEALYIAEEEVGLYAFSFNLQKKPKKTLIARVGEYGLKGDLEGVSLFQTDNQNGYIIVSDQGADQFAVFDKVTSKHLFNFSIEQTKDIDAVTHTDGLHLVSYSKIPGWTGGVLIVQDDQDDQHGGVKGQNLKLVSWNEIVRKAPLELIRASSFDPRFFAREVSYSAH